MSDPWRPTIPYSSQRMDRCFHGARCTYLSNNKCKFFHTDEDYRRAAECAASRAGQTAAAGERLALVTKGLSEGFIDLGGPGTEADNYVDVDVGTRLGHLRITAERVLASFNKLADNKIAVPGCPPRFAPPAHAIHVDSDKRATDDILRPFPTYSYSLEPLVRSVQCMSPDFDVLGGACDIVANAGSLYRLFKYLTNELFFTTRCDLEWRQNPADGGSGTLLMQQWKNDPDHQTSLGHGNNFAAATCHFPADLPDCLQTSFTHHRVLYYELGGLRFAVHCEADGWYDPLSVFGKQQMPLTPPVSPKLAMPTPLSPRSKGSRFSVLMEDEEDEDIRAIPTSDTLTIDYPCGPAVPIPAAQLVEIKTHNAKKFDVRKSHANTAAPKTPYVLYKPDSQLYFGRIQQLYETGHKNGVFPKDVPVENVNMRLQQWEADKQRDLKRMLAVLQKMRMLAVVSAAQGQPRMSLVLPGTQVRKGKDKRAKLHQRDDEVAFLPEGL